MGKLSGPSALCVPSTESPQPPKTPDSLSSNQREPRAQVGTLVQDPESQVESEAECSRKTKLNSQANRRRMPALANVS